MPLVALWNVLYKDKNIVDDIQIVIRKHNRRSEGREDGSETNDDKVGLLTSAIMEEELDDPDNLPV